MLRESRASGNPSKYACIIHNTYYQNKHDSRSMVSLGNLYFDNKSKYENNLKESYKFYFHVLNEDNRNVFGANGLGMVCAEKGEVDAAREIFAKVLYYYY